MKSHVPCIRVDVGSCRMEEEEMTFRLPTSSLGERGVLSLGGRLLFAPRGPRGGATLVLILAVVLKWNC